MSGNSAFGTTFQKSVTSKGLRVLTETHPASRGVSVHLWVEVGTRDESLEQVGISHLIEHMVFKGTENMNGFQISSSLESVGGDLNAYTGREFTCYHTLSLAKDLELSLKVLSELTTRPLFLPEDLQKEKRVVLQEMDMTTDLLEEVIFDDFFTWVYPRDPAGWPILGTPASVESVKESTLKSFFRDRYHAGNLILTVVGPMEHQQVLDLAEKHFEGVLQAGKAPVRAEPKFSDFKVFCQRPSEQTHFIVGRPSSSYKDKFRFEAYIVNALLGGGMTSRLYQRIREELGLAYNVGSILHSYKDSGLMLISGAAHPESIPQVLDEIQRAHDTLYREGVPKEEMEMFKAQIQGQILLGADDLENRASSLGVNEMAYGTYRSVDYVMSLIEDVSQESIEAYLAEQAKNDTWSLYLLGAGEMQGFGSWSSQIQPIQESSHPLS